MLVIKAKATHGQNAASRRTSGDTDAFGGGAPNTTGGTTGPTG